MLLRNSRALDLSNDLENVPVPIEGDFSEAEFPLFQYSPDNIQGPGCAVDPCEVTLPGCTCLSLSCCAETCSCLQTYGKAYDGSGALSDSGLEDGALCKPVFECHALCACSEACSNRVVQRGLRTRLEVYPTGDRGWGVRTLAAIPRGTFVCEYAGEVIGTEEARRRQLSQGPGDNNYIIVVREYTVRGPVTETYVDPTRVGNVGRFLNHSCLPNLAMVPVRAHSAVPRLALFAGRDVGAWEELTFDYAGGRSSQRHAEQAAQSEAAMQASRIKGPQRKACHCGAQNCTGFLPLDLTVLHT